MKLSRVDIHGFKSFAQRTELNFDKGITGIVGPNGSGKSNIADAVRWVLGEQSAKILRGSKMEDVIFNGTQTKKALPYCEVSLQFDNDDRALNSPYSEVLVTRRVYRNGEGEYFLNRSSCRLKDIIELFRDTGIGKEGYSIIGQGRIEEILSTKGDERRQVFEEAAGIVTFRVRKEEAERKLNKTRDNLNRVNDLIEEISARIGPLELQARTAQEFLSLSERLRQLEIDSYLVRHEKLFSRLNSLRELTNGLQTTIQSYNQQLIELNQLRNSHENLLEVLEVQDQEARDAFNQAQANHHMREQELQTHKNQLASLQLDEQRLLEKLNKDEETIEDLSQLFFQNENDRLIKLELQKEAETVCRQDEECLFDLLHKSDEAEKQLDIHKTKIITALTRMSDAKSMQTRQQTMLAQMQERIKEIIFQKITLTEQKDELNHQTEKSKTLLIEAENHFSVLTDDAASMDNKLDLAKSSLNAALIKLQEITSQVLAAQNRLKLLEELTREYEGYNHAVKKALQYASNNLKVYGVIAQLIKVPKEYETALDMILGGTLQHIVTDDEQTAKDLIDYLRSNKLGRTTFLPITAIKGRTLNHNERQMLNQPGCIGIVSELIQYDKKLNGVVESILGRTVLVVDMDSGIALSRKAKQSFNVVTLAGDVLRAGGAMTGGTSHARVSSLLGREREISELKEFINSSQLLLTQAKKEKDAANSSLITLTKLSNESLQAVNQQRIVIARQQERCDNAQNELDAVLKRFNDTQGALTQLEEAIIEIEMDLSAVKLLTDTEAVDHRSLENETNRLQDLLLATRKKAEQQREKLSSSQLLCSNLAHKFDLVSRDKSRVEKEMNLLSHSAKKTTEDIELTKNNIILCEKTTEELSRALLDSSMLVVQSKEKWDGIIKSRIQTQGLQKTSINDIELLHDKMEQDKEKLHRNELVFTRVENEMQNLSDYIFNSYELTHALAKEQQSQENLNLPQAEIEIKKIKQRIRNMGSINVGAIEEYAVTRERFDTMTVQRNDALQAEQDLLELINQLLGKMEIQFIEEFRKLNDFFAETFVRLFGGGKAELILSDTATPLTCDIEVAAQPPGKKLQMLSLLSGGERALTAIAILFAMLKLKPTPFCVLDEIEAALDEANISNFADYLSEYAQSTQFIIITHRKGTMECCDALYGVAMEEKGVSSMVSVNLHHYTAS